MGFLFAQTFSGLSDDVTNYIKEICRLHNMDENRAMKEVKEGIDEVNPLSFRTAGVFCEGWI